MARQTYCSKMHGTFKDGHAETIQNKTGLVLDAYFQEQKFNGFLAKMKKIEDSLSQESLFLEQLTPGSFGTYLMGNIM